MSVTDKEYQTRLYRELLAVYSQEYVRLMLEENLFDAENLREKYVQRCMEIQNASAEEVTSTKEEMPF